MAWQQNASFPVCSNYLSLAIDLHKSYADAVDAWYGWLEDGQGPSNAEQLLLWRMINLTLERRSRGGVWEHLDEKIVPNRNALSMVIDWEKYSGFGFKVESLRRPVEDKALTLVMLLDSAELREEVANLPVPQRWEHLAQLADKLSASNVGMKYMRKSVCETQDLNPLPAIHPDQLKTTLTWTTATSQARRAARAYAHLALKLMPALLADEKYDKFVKLSLDFVAHYFPDDVVGALTIEEKVAEARDWLKSNKPWWASDQLLAARVQAAFDVINIGLAIVKLASDPGVGNLAAVARAATSLASSVSSWAKVALGEESLLSFSKSTSAIIADLNAVYDVLMGVRALYATREAARTGDYSVAAGQLMQGVGLGTAAGITAGISMAEAGWFAGSALIPGLQVVALGALVLILAGTIIAEYTKDSQFEQWLQNCWFGRNWESVTATERPDTPMYRTKRVDGTPDIAQQVSFWLSVFYPIRAKITRRSNPEFLKLECAPTFALRDSEVYVWRIDDEGGFFSSGPFNQELIYTAPIDDTRDAGVGFLTEGAPPDERVVDWTAGWEPHRWWQGRKDTYDMKGHWVQVELTFPARFASDLIQDLMHSRGRRFSFPFVVRARVKVD